SRSTPFTCWILTATWSPGTQGRRKSKVTPGKKSSGKISRLSTRQTTLPQANRNATCARRVVADTFVIRVCESEKTDQLSKRRLSLLRFMMRPGKFAVSPKSHATSLTKYGAGSLKRKKLQRKKQARRRTIFWQRSAMNCARP